MKARARCSLTTGLLPMLVHCSVVLRHVVVVLVSTNTQASQACKMTTGSVSVCTRSR